MTGGLLVALGVGLLLRALFFTGLAYGDDVIYMGQVIAHAVGGSWPPDPYHWHTRLGVTIPAAAAVWAFGLNQVTLVLWPLVVSLWDIVMAWLFARDSGETTGATLAALLMATFPFEVIYGTHLYPDLLSGSFTALSLWLWIRALRGDRARDYLVSGGALAMAYLCRVTCVMAAPVYLVLWISAGRLRRPRVWWAAVIPVAVVALEMALYSATAGSAMYRFQALARERADSQNVAEIRASTAGGTFLTDPLIMLGSSHEYGLHFTLALVVAVYALWKWPRMRPAALWVVVGWLWLSYGTTVPTDWVTLYRDPRYNASLILPAMVLLGHFLARLPVRLRWGAMGVLALSGIAASGLDQGRAQTTPHRAFLRGEWAGTAAVQPFDYFVARWHAGLATPASFPCMNDTGNATLMQEIAALPGTRFVSSEETPYVVFNDRRRGDLRAKLESRGWTEVARIDGEPNTARLAVGRMLACVPSQQERAKRILTPPDLVVMRNPRMNGQPAVPR